jgi:hypothetical protein
VSYDIADVSGHSAIAESSSTAPQTETETPGDHCPGNVTALVTSASVRQQDGSFPQDGQHVSSASETVNPLQDSQAIDPARREAINSSSSRRIKKLPHPDGSRFTTSVRRESAVGTGPLPIVGTGVASPNRGVRVQRLHTAPVSTSGSLEASMSLPFSPVEFFAGPPPLQRNSSQASSSRDVTVASSTDISCPFEPSVTQAYL